MRKLLLGAFVLFVAATGTRAQTQTNVTGTIVDPNGIPYGNGTYSVQLVPTGNNPTVNGASIGGAFNGRLDANGAFNISLWPNGSIVPASTTWQFTICISPGIQPPLGTGGQCTPPTPITISGTSQDVSSTLNAVAPKLTNFISSGTVTTVTGSAPIVSSGGATPAISCPTCNTSSATIAGTVSASHLTYASGANTAADVAGSAVTGATGAIALTAGADTTTPLTISVHSSTASVVPFIVNTVGVGTTPPTARSIINTTTSSSFLETMLSSGIYSSQTGGGGFVDQVQFGAGNWSYNSTNPSAVWHIFEAGPSGSVSFALATGTMTNYANLATAGNGIAAVFGADDHTAEITGNYGPITLLANTFPTGFYVVTIYAEVSTSVATSTITTSIAYHDDTGAQTQTGVLFSGATAGTIQSLTFSVRLVTGTALTYSTTTANSPKYKIFARVQEL